MTKSTPQTLTLIVRLWTVTNEQDEPIWRGSIDRIPNGIRVYFQSLEHLCEYIVAILEADQGSELEG